MPTEQEIQRMVVRLIGDSESYQKMFKEAVRASKTYEKANEEATKAEQRRQHIMNVGKTVTASVATATDQYENAVAELNTLVKEGAITQETYNRALKKVQDNLDLTENKMRNMGQTLVGIGQSMKSVGTTMSIALTVPIVAAGAGAVMAASDAEETASKFAVTFSEVETQANAAAQELDDFYQMSSTGAKRALANTGDLLAGFGFTGEAALDLSVKVNKLAGDLASFQNLEGGAARASAALTKALLGERESAKELGLVIMEKDVQERIALNTTKGVIYETERQAKAYATLEIALEQSKNAVGDSIRTADSFANSQKELINDILDVSISFGKIMIPTLSKVIKAVKDVLEWVDNLSDGWKQTIVVVGATVAVVGPLLVIAGQLVTSYGMLTIALSSATAAQTAFNVAAVAGKFAVAGLAIGGIVALQVAIYNMMPSIKDFNEQLKIQAELADKAAQFQSKHSQAILDTAASLSGAEKKEFLQAELEMAQKNSQGIKEEIDSIAAEMERVAPSAAVEWENLWRTLTGQIPRAGKAIWEAEKEQLDQRKRDLEEHNQLVRNLEKQLEGLGGVAEPLGATPEAVEAAEKYLEQLQTQADMFDVGKDQAKLYALEKQRISKATLEEIDTAQQRIAKLESEKKAYEESAATLNKNRQAAQSFIDTLQQQVFTFGMSSDEARLYALSLDGVTEAQKQSAKEWIAIKKAQEEGKKTMEEGKALMEQYKTPIERLRKEWETAKRLFEEGAIDRTTAERVVADIKKRMDELNESAKIEVEFKVQGVDAVIAGTNEARARIGEYLGSIPTRIPIPRGGARAGAEATAREGARRPLERVPVAVERGGGGEAVDYPRRAAVALERIVVLLEAEGGLDPIGGVKVQGANL